MKVLDSVAIPQGWTGRRVVLTRPPGPETHGPLADSDDAPSEKRLPTKCCLASADERMETCRTEGRRSLHNGPCAEYGDADVRSW